LHKNILTIWRSIQQSSDYHDFFNTYINKHYTQKENPTCDLHCYEQKAEFILQELQGSDVSREECETIMLKLYEYLTGWSDSYVKDSIRKSQMRLVDSMGLGN
jgi:hypothetical protein